MNEYERGIAEEAKQELIARASEIAHLKHIQNAGSRATKVFPIARAYYAVNDAVTGFNNAGDLYSTPEPTWQQKAASTVGQVSQGLTMGLIPAKEATYGLVPKKFEPTTPTKEQMANYEKYKDLFK